MKKFWLLGSLTILLYTASAQSPGDSTARHDVMQPKRKAWVKPALALGYAGAGLLCYRFADAPVQRWSQSHRTGAEDFVFREVSDMGLGHTETYALLGTTALAFLIRNERLKETSLTWAMAAWMNSASTSFLKDRFHRHRPSSGDPYNTFDGRHGPPAHASMPSGHTSNAFTIATVFATEYRDVKWVPYVSYGLASLVGLSRIYHNAHWASDVMAGAALGFLNAKAAHGIYRLAARKLSFLPGAAKKAPAATTVY